MKKPSILFLRLLAGAACTEKGEPKQNLPRFRHFVGSYIEPDTIVAWVGYPPPDPALPRHSASEAVYDRMAVGINLGYTPSQTVIIRDTGPTAGRYDSICRANGDTSYYSHQTLTLATHRRVESLHVVSDQPYDAAHPAGASLDDLISIRFVAADRYIADEYRYTGPGAFFDGRLESLSAFNAKQRRILSFHLELYFRYPPDAEREHCLHIAYRDEDGKTLRTPLRVVPIGR